MSVVETAQHDVKEILKKVREHLKSAKQQIEDVCHIYEDSGKIQKDQIGSQVKQDCRDLGYTEDEIDYIRHCIPSEYKDHKFDSIGGQTSTLENLNPEQVPEGLQGFFDEYTNKDNLDTLGPAEREELLKKMKKDLGLVKNKIPGLSKLLDKVGESYEIFLEPEKTGKTLPPSEFWGPSEIYERVLEREAMLTIMLKDVKDIRQQLFKFKPNQEIDQSLCDKFDHVNREVFEPIDKLIFTTNDAYMTLTDPNVDDKWGETLSKWMEIGADKYLAFGNHGSGEIHSVLTGKYVMRLNRTTVLDEDTGETKAVDAVVTVPIKREFTREQVADKVLMKLLSAIDCPVCKERFKLPDEYMDLIAGDLFDRAHKALLVNPLTQFLDAMTNDIVLVKEFKSPQQFYREQCALYRKKVTEEEIANVATIEVKPEKIKLETLQKMEFNMKYGNADRRHNMAEHFSDQS